MATITNAFTSVGVTTNLANYASPSFTPVAGDLLVAIFGAADTVEPNATMTASANGLTFTRIDPPATKSADTSTLYAFVANQLVPASPVAMTLTLGLPVDIGGGCVHMCARVAGMTRTGASAIRQAGINSNGAHPAAPTASLPAAALTTNPVLFSAMYTNVGPSSPPTGWTEGADTGFSTPTFGAEYAWVNSGFTGTAVAMAAGNLGAWGARVIELDTSAAGGGGGPTPFEGWGVPI